MIGTPGDIRTLPLPGRIDVVLLANVIHGFDDETNARLIRRAASTLNPGGSLYILDQMRGTRRSSFLSDFTALVVGLNLVNEAGGTAYTVGRVRNWCAGARKFSVRSLKFPGVVLTEAGNWVPG